MRKIIAAAAFAAGLVASALGAAAQERAEVDSQAIERSREIVRMIDAIYKNAIVLITEKYVNDADDFPAGSAAVELFRRISQGGFHNVRLIDVTGRPYRSSNVAESEFEKGAVEKIGAGDDYVETVVQRNGEAYLQAATAVPVVMEKCIMCHPHYREAKENNQAIGAIVYELPVR